MNLHNDRYGIMECLQRVCSGLEVLYVNFYLLCSLINQFNQIDHLQKDYTWNNNSDILNCDINIILNSYVVMSHQQR